MNEDKLRGPARWASVGRQRLGPVSRLIERVGGFFFLPALAILITTDVILRYFFNAPLTWGLELNEHLLIFVFMFALPQCTRSNGHIYMDLFSRHMPAVVQRISTISYCVVGAGVFGLIAHKAAGDIPFMFHLPAQTEFLDLPLWAFNLMVAAVSAFLVVDYLLRAVALAFGAEDNRTGGETSAGGLF